MADPNKAHHQRRSPGNFRHHVAGTPLRPAVLSAGLDRAAFHRVADATLRSLLTRVAEVLGPTEPDSTVQRAGRTGAAARRAAAKMP